MSRVGGWQPGRACNGAGQCGITTKGTPPAQRLLLCLESNRGGSTSPGWVRVSIRGAVEGGRNVVDCGAEGVERGQVDVGRGGAGGGIARARWESILATAPAGVRAEK